MTIEDLRCLYTSPDGMIVQMMQSSNDGEWTRDDSCPTDTDGVRQPLVIALAYRLDALVAPWDPYQQFRCVRAE